MDVPPAGRSSAVSFRRIGKERTDQGLVLTVFCPQQTAVVPISECRACAHCKGLSIDTSDGDSFLRCNYATPQPTFDPPSPSGSARTEASVGDLMTTPVRCVTKDTTAERLLRIFLEDGISAVPVINGEGHPIGMVSKTDLLREEFRGALPEELELLRHTTAGSVASSVAADAVEAQPERTVGELMTPFVFSLPVDAPVSLAAALMSYEAVHRIAVTERDGMVIGILSSLDVMRWLAVDRGYTVPPRRRRERL
jgi:CBS domain-containing protein